MGFVYFSGAFSILFIFAVFLFLSSTYLGFDVLLFFWSYGESLDHKF